MENRSYRNPNVAPRGAVALAATMDAASTGHRLEAARVLKNTYAIAEGSATSIAASPPQKSPAGFSSLGSFMSCGKQKGMITV